MFQECEDHHKGDVIDFSLNMLLRPTVICMTNEILSVDL